ncbi:MAG: large subunit ribosomal protein L19 [Parvicella sp.]
MHPEIDEKETFITMDIIKELQAELVETKVWPEFSAGDTINVTYKIKEGEKERLQSFQGVVLQRRGNGSTETFTIRKISGNIGVERVFPVNNPFLETIKVIKKGSVRRARIYYLRDLKGKAARIKEKRAFVK